MSSSIFFSSAVQGHSLDVVPDDGFAGDAVVRPAGLEWRGGGGRVVCPVVELLQGDDQAAPGGGPEAGGRPRLGGLGSAERREGGDTG